MTDYRVKMQENEKNKQIFGPCQRTKKILNMKVKVTPIVVDVFGTVLKDL